MSNVIILQCLTVFLSNLLAQLNNLYKVYRDRFWNKFFFFNFNLIVGKGIGNENKLQ